MGKACVQISSNAVFKRSAIALNPNNSDNLTTNH